VQSLCDRTATALQSLYNRSAITLQSPCNRFEIALKSLFNRCAIAQQSRSNRTAIAVRSLQNRFARGASANKQSYQFVIAKLNRIVFNRCITVPEPLKRSHSNSSTCAGVRIGSPLENKRIITSWQGLKCSLIAAEQSH
jgi:hypothetical protein